MGTERKPALILHAGTSRVPAWWRGPRRHPKAVGSQGEVLLPLQGGTNAQNGNKEINGQLEGAGTKVSPKEALVEGGLFLTDGLNLNAGGNSLLGWKLLHDKRLSAEKRRDVVLASSLPPPLPPGKRKIQLWPQKKPIRQTGRRQEYKYQ